MLLFVVMFVYMAAIPKKSHYWTKHSEKANAMFISWLKVMFFSSSSCCDMSPMHLISFVVIKHDDQYKSSSSARASQRVDPLWKQACIWKKESAKKEKNVLLNGKESNAGKDRKERKGKVCVVMLMHVFCLDFFRLYSLRIRSWSTYSFCFFVAFFKCWSSNRASE